MYPKNTWYVACTPDEIADKPLGRQICGEKIVFYRGVDNKVVALEDFCPHRGAPLSLGFVRDGNLVDQLTAAAPDGIAAAVARAGSGACSTAPTPPARCAWSA